jgi:hypothetical protein
MGWLDVFRDNRCVCVGVCVCLATAAATTNKTTQELADAPDEDD